MACHLSIYHPASPVPHPKFQLSQHTHSLSLARACSPIPFPSFFFRLVQSSLPEPDPYDFFTIDCDGGRGRVGSRAYRANTWCPQSTKIPPSNLSALPASVGKGEGGIGERRYAWDGMGWTEVSATGSRLQPEKRGRGWYPSIRRHSRLKHYTYSLSLLCNLNPFSFVTIASPSLSTTYIRVWYLILEEKAGKGKGRETSTKKSRDSKK